MFGLCDLDAGVKQKIFSTAIQKLGYEEYHMCNSKIGCSIFYKSSKFTLVDQKYYEYEEISDQIGNLNSMVKCSNDHEHNIEEFKEIHSTQEFFIYVHLKLKKS